MRVSQIPSRETSPNRSAWEELTAFLAARRASDEPIADLAAFERKLHEHFASAEAEVMGEELERFDLEAPEVLIDGVHHRRVLRCAQTYQAASGPVTVMRTLYSTRQEGARCVCPLELRAGLVEGFWTPQASKQAALSRDTISYEVRGRHLLRPHLG
jgi:hypothetical protein